jgi:hypothetical protein
VREDVVDRLPQLRVVERERDAVGLNLRLYEPQQQRWSLTFVNVRDGVGEFHGDDQLGGRPIKVRFRIARPGPGEARFEQAFSADGGTTWETNWIAVDRRIRR